MRNETLLHLCGWEDTAEIITKPRPNEMFTNIIPHISKAWYICGSFSYRTYSFEVKQSVLMKLWLWSVFLLDEIAVRLGKILVVAELQLLLIRKFWSQEQKSWEVCRGSFFCLPKVPLIVWNDTVCLILNYLSFKKAYII